MDDDDLLVEWLPDDGEEGEEGNKKNKLFSLKGRRMIVWGIRRIVWLAAVLPVLT